MSADARDVVTRMRAIEDNVTGETGEDAPPLDRVVATLLDVEYDGLDAVLHEQALYVVVLFDKWYAAKFNLAKTPTNIAALAFVQGVTFAVAAQRMRADSLRAQLVAVEAERDLLNLRLDRLHALWIERQRADGR